MKLKEALTRLLIRQRFSSNAKIKGNGFEISFIYSSNADCSATIYAVLRTEKYESLLSPGFPYNPFFPEMGVEESYINAFMVKQYLFENEDVEIIWS
jgi:hypothetical protein